MTRRRITPGTFRPVTDAPDAYGTPPGLVDLPDRYRATEDAPMFELDDLTPQDAPQVTAGTLT